jgi:hypothetical protein
MSTVYGFFIWPGGSDSNFRADPSIVDPPEAFDPRWHEIHSECEVSARNVATGQGTRGRVPDPVTGQRSSLEALDPGSSKSRMLLEFFDP